MRASLPTICAAVFLWTAGALGPRTAVGACAALPGDVNGSQSVTVSDVQCAVLLSLWSLTLGPGPMPACVAVPLSEADINCSSAFDVSDVLLLIQATLGAAPDPELDKDGNGCIDACQQGDGECAAFECTDYPSDCCKPGLVCTGDSCGLSSDCDFTPACGGKACPVQLGACDDGDVCTTGNVCLGASCSAGFPLNCNDGDPCTSVECDPTAGCVYKPIPGCTCIPPPGPFPVDCCIPNAAPGCSSPACTDCVCGVVPGCCSAAWNQVCVDLASPGGSCNDVCACDLPGADPPPGDPLCWISGAPGQKVLCPLRLTAGDAVSPHASALQLTLSYDPTLVKLVGFFGETCFGPNQTPPCVKVSVAGPGSMPLMTGHSVSLSPASPTLWNGFGALLIVHISNTSAAITNAWVDPCGTIQGKPYVLEAAFEVLQPIAPSNQTAVWADDPAANFVAKTNSQVLQIVFWPEEQTFVTWP